MKNSLSYLRFAGFFLAGFIAALDQISKKWITGMADAYMLPVKVLPFFNLSLVFNKGISFGLLANRPEGWSSFLLPACLGAITLMLCFWLIRAQEKTVITALGLIIGGAAGNLIDRARIGVVTDFLDFHLGHYHFPAFNVADSAIFIGVVIFVFTNIIWQQKPEVAPHEN